MPDFDALLQPENRSTEVGYLVQIDADIVYRFCSWGNVEWEGELWTGGAIKGITRSDQASYAPSGAITFNDPDVSLMASMLNHGISAKRIRIWYTPVHDFSVPPYLWLDAYTDDIADTATGMQVGIVADDGQHNFTPRKRVTKNLFPYLLPPGATLKYANGEFTLQWRGI